MRSQAKSVSGCARRPVQAGSGPVRCCVSRSSSIIRSVDAVRRVGCCWRSWCRRWSSSRCLNARSRRRRRLGGLGLVKKRARELFAAESGRSRVADLMTCWGDSMRDLERRRVDEAGVQLRGGGRDAAAAPRFVKLARRDRRLASARGGGGGGAGARTCMDAELGRDAGGGRRRWSSTRPAWRSNGRKELGCWCLRTRGSWSTSSLICAWAQRCRLLGSELLAGNGLDARRRAAAWLFALRAGDPCPTATEWSARALRFGLQLRQSADILQGAFGALLDLRAAFWRDVAALEAHRR